jgi:hypothetical protein
MILRNCVLVGWLLFGAPSFQADPANAREKSIRIPLKEIWASGMRSCGDIRALEPEVYGDEARRLSAEERQARFQDSKVKQIIGALDFLSEESGKVASDAFVVEGTKEDALSDAASILTEKLTRREEFAEGEDLWLVFFSHRSGRLVQLTNVKRDGYKIAIEYEFVPRKSQMLSAHFALIPLGKLSNGRYQVHIAVAQQSPIYEKAGIKPLTPDAVDRIVSKSFSFAVSKEGID